MRRFLSLLLAVLLAGFLLAPLQGQAAEEAEFDGYLVRLNDAGARNGLMLLGADGWEEVTDGLYLVEDLETALAMDQLGLAAYYEPNYRLELLEGDCTTAQWNLLAVNAQAAWDHTDSAGSHDARGDGVTVAVIDSGVYAAHPDFNQANLLDCCNLAGTAGGVDGWHGTFVAGVIAAQVGNGIGVDGVTPDVTILPICITKSGLSTTSLLVEAIDYAVEQDVDVINLSIGGKTSSLAMEEACRKALDAGIILVAAAGNYKAGEAKSSGTYMYPASFDGVVSVSACRQDGTDVVFDDSYSYFNDQVTVAAPGTAVQSLDPDGGVSTQNGTSFAAPVVTAMAAMAKQRSHSITPEAFGQLLTSTAADLGEAGYDICYGHGLVDIAAFVDALDREYSITYDLGGPDAAFGADTRVPASYALGGSDIPLPEPVRPGYRFLGWYETADRSGDPAAAIPAGTVGDLTYYAAWEPIPICYFAQYDAAGRMLAVTRLPQGETEPDGAEILENAALGKLFRLDSSGAPLEAARSIPLNTRSSP